jgi:hypothetical protein
MERFTTAKLRSISFVKLEGRVAVTPNRDGYRRLT